VPEVAKLLNAHLKENYDAHIVFSEADVAHWLLAREHVIYAWVVEDSKGKITDLLSYYELNSHILNHPVHKNI